MELLLLLLMAHFIGDFYLQPLQWVECRFKHGWRSIGLLKHVAVHSGLYLLVIWIADLIHWKSFLIVLMLSVSHYLTDVWKSYRPPALIYFLIDQALHIVFIFMAWVTLSAIGLSELLGWLSDLFSAKHLLFIFGFLLVCRPTSILIAMMLKKHTDALFSGAKEQPSGTKVTVEEPALNKVVVSLEAATDGESSNKQEQNVGLAQAGAYIGYIERCLTLGFILLGQFSAIGFLVAAKTIFRFGDLTKSKDMKLTEYMLLGTLLSYAIAIFVGVIVLKVSNAFVS